jgi:WXG100 family type VII secretion target
VATKIVADPAKLISAAAQIDSQAAEYQKQYNLLFSQVDGMGQSWQGADNLAFVNQIDGFKDDFLAMHNFLMQYSDFLKSTGASYASTQQDGISLAKSLTN